MDINTFLEHKEMDTPNVMVVKELYKALNGGDNITLTRMLNDNPTWNVCPGNPEGGTYCGMDEVFNTFYGKVMKNFHVLVESPKYSLTAETLLWSWAFTALRFGRAAQSGASGFRIHGN